MKIVIPGGTGQVGAVLTRHFRARGDEVVLIGRSDSPKSAPDESEGASRRDGEMGSSVRHVAWDGRTVGPWANEIDGADVVINLAGRSVNCRYTKENMAAMMSSRVDSTRAVGIAIAQATRPPPVWLQMSTATIYAHRFDAPNDEDTGMIGGQELGVPRYWKFSVDIARAWEKTQAEATTPSTRKIALRSTMVMSPDREGIFDVLLGLVRKGLGGPMAGGAQYVSWIHDADFARAISFLLGRDDIVGAVNLASPHPLPQREFMEILRDAASVRIGLPATKWMAQIGAFFLRTDAELTLKSRRVVPKRLCDAGFAFEWPEWKTAAKDLVRRSASKS